MAEFLDKRDKKPLEVGNKEFARLSGAWKYYEANKHLWASKMFPGELVEDYFGPGSNVSESSRRRIAYQFASGERPAEQEACDGDEKRAAALKAAAWPWSALLAFCRQYMLGSFPTVVAVDMAAGLRERIKAFPCQDEWVPLEKYLANPFREWVIQPDMVSEVEP